MNNFVKEIHYIILLFQIFAIAPITLKKRNPLFIQMFSFVSLLIILIIVSSVIFINDFFEHKSIVNIVNYLIFSSILLTNLIIVVQSYVTRNKQLNIVKNILAIDEILLQKLEKYLKYTEQRKRFNQKVFGLFFVWTFMLVYTVVLMFLRYTFIDFVLMMQFIYPLLMIRVRCIQIIFYADVLHARLKTISDILIYIINCERDVHESTVKTIYVSEKMEPNMENIEYVELVSLKKIYSLLWDTNCLMNDCFGWSLLLIYTQYFLRLTADCYFLYLIFIKALTNNEQYDALCDAITILSILWLVCNGCRRCTQKVCYFYI